MTESAQGERFSLVFDSAAIFAGNIRPRIELPAPAHLRRDGPLESPHTVEIIESDDQGVRGSPLGFASPQHFLLVLPSDDYDRLQERVGTIRDNRMKVEVVVDDHGQIVRVTIDGRPVRPHRSRSGVTSELDFDIDEEKAG